MIIDKNSPLRDWLIDCIVSIKDYDLVPIILENMIFDIRGMSHQEVTDYHKKLYEIIDPPVDEKILNHTVWEGLRYWIVMDALFMLEKIDMNIVSDSYHFIDNIRWIERNRRVMEFDNEMEYMLSDDWIQ